MSHTKGPWHYQGDTLTHRMFDIYAPFGGNAGVHMHVCTVNNLPHRLLIGRKPEQALANARLIAAAPELLEALYLALPYVETAALDTDFKPGAVERVVKQIRAAIAKADYAEPTT